MKAGPIKKELVEISNTRDELYTEIQSLIQSVLSRSVDLKTANAKIKEYRKRGSLLDKRLKEELRKR